MITHILFAEDCEEGCCFIVHINTIDSEHQNRSKRIDSEHIIDMSYHAIHLFSFKSFGSDFESGVMIEHHKMLLYNIKHT